MTIEEFDKVMENIPKIQINNSISSMNSINVDELRKTVEIFKRIPTFDDLQKENNKLLKENQQLKEQLKTSEKARKEANKIILECLLSEEYNTLNSDYLSIVFFKLTKVLNLDIDKGE